MRWPWVPQRDSREETLTRLETVADRLEEVTIELREKIVKIKPSKNGKIQDA